jgi:hypothetical protein
MFDFWLVSVDYVDSGVGFLFSHCIGYYDNQIDKLNLVNWLIGEMGLNTHIIVSYIVVVELLTQH